MNRVVLLRTGDDAVEARERSEDGAVIRDLRLGAAELPNFELDRTETPSPTNSLGVKGVGEAGTIAGSPAVVNAVIDALRPLGVEFLNMPLGSMRVWEAIQEAKGKQEAVA